MGLLYKDESGKAKQAIKPKTWTYVKFQGRDKFLVPTKGEWEWTIVLRCEFPAGATGDVLRGRLVRFPGTSKADETGHDDKNISNWGGDTYHCHWTHTIDADPKMPIGFWVWHNCSKPIVLDGRQIKAKSV